jgi:hypothetical protein
MSTRYHINPESGRANICRTDKGTCPFGSIPHGDSKEEARENFERSMKSQELAAIRKATPKPEPTAGEKAMEPWLTYLKGKIDHPRNDVSGREAMRADYSRAVSFSRGKKAATEATPKEETLNGYIDYLKELLPSRMGRHYKEQEARQAEYNRIIAFARGRGLTTR